MLYASRVLLSEVVSMILKDNGHLVLSEVAEKLFEGVGKLILIMNNTKNKLV